MLEAFERLYGDEKCVRRAIANHYSSRSPSSFIGRILSHIGTKKIRHSLKRATDLEEISISIFDALEMKKSTYSSSDSAPK